MKKTNRKAPTQENTLREEITEILDNFDVTLTTVNPSDKEYYMIRDDNVKKLEQLIKEREQASYERGKLEPGEKPMIMKLDPEEIDWIRQDERERVIQEIKEAVNQSEDLHQFGSASGSMMKSSMLKYLDGLLKEKKG